MQKEFDRWLNTRWNHPEKRKLIGNTLQSFIIQAVSITLVFAGNLLLTRWSGAGNYSKYVHVFNWISILSVIVVGGREDLVLVEIGRIQAEKQDGLIRGLVIRVNRQIFLAAVLIGLSFTAIVSFLPVGALHEYYREFLAGAAAIFFLAFLTLNQSVLQALHYVRLSQVVERLARPLILILFLAIAWINGLRADARTLIILAVSGIGACCIILAWLVFQKIGIYGSQPGRPTLKKAEATKSLYFFSITLMTMLITKVCMLILPYFAPDKDIGIFNISLRFADLIVYPFFLMHAVLPQLFVQHSYSEVKGSGNLFRFSTKLMTALSLPLLAFNILAGHFLLGIFGREFVEGYGSLVLLSIAQFLFSLFGPANTVLMMQDRERTSALYMLVYVLLLILLSLWLIPKMGIIGGAWSMLISCLIYNIILSISVYRIFGIISPFFSFLTLSNK